MESYWSREDSYYTTSGATFGDPTYLRSIYNQGIETNLVNIPLPDPVTVQDADGNESKQSATPRKATQSIFNRYSLFYYNSMSLTEKPENYYDSPNRLEDALTPITAKFVQEGDAAGTASGERQVVPRGAYLNDVLKNPSASNLIQWASAGNGDPRLGTNAVEYAWEDFLWCKNYGIVPNNYMVTLRRFPQPTTDDLFDSQKIINPDISRMITWVDGESNTWESVGLKFSSMIKWKELESEIQTLSGGSPTGRGKGNEGDMIGGKVGNIVKSAAWIMQKPPGSPPGAFASNDQQPAGKADPYQNANKTFGPLDVIKKMWMRDKGLEFEQTFTLKFEYELRSIDGINPKVAMIDLLSNVFVMTANRGEFWGGDIRFFNGSGGTNNSKKVGPFGDPKKLAAGDYSGYFKSITDGLKSKYKSFGGGDGLTLEGVATAGKNIVGNLLSNAIGGALDNSPGMGAAGAQAINSLLTGEETGHWHVMVGNPARPIISVGNLILNKSEYHLHGPVGNDDFPSKLTVTCTLVPARGRDRSDMIAMFHRGGRTYTTLSPADKGYAGNKKVPGLRKRSKPADKGYASDKEQQFAFEEVSNALPLMAYRFPNHNAEGIIEQLTNAAQGIY